MLNIFFSLLSF